jgi:hypothetical protein
VKATEGVYGLRPGDLHSAYQLPTAASSVQTIALVDAYNDPGAEADLKVYDQEFGLPECTTANGCFEQVGQTGPAGSLPFPKSKEAMEAMEATCAIQKITKAGEAACKEVAEAKGWRVEISTDIEAARAICQNCRIVLVEANSASFSDLEAAEETAGRLGASEISNSWGGPESPGPPTTDTGSVFDQPGIAITAAAGDNGYLDWSAAESSARGFADYPASSPHVIAVGGTRLNLSAGGAWASETVWNGEGAGGSGCSVLFTAQPWQREVTDWSSVGCGTSRAVADVSADADPYTGVAVYDSEPGEEGETWRPVGGTSVASPIVASVFALAGGAHGVGYPARTLYENEVKAPGSLHDVLSGSNGKCNKTPLFRPDGTSSCTPSEEAAASNCSNTLICLAGPGYDGPTGVGTPDGIAAFQPPVAQTSGKEGAKEPEKGPATVGPSTGGGSGVSTAGQPRPGTNVAPPSGAASPTLIPPSHGLTAQPMIRLSALALTRSAILTLNRVRPKLSQVAFSFTLSVAARVRVTLAKRFRVRGHTRWEVMSRALTIAAVAGRNRHRLAGSRVLAPGRYRLTLTPPHSAARSIFFRIA